MAWVWAKTQAGRQEIQARAKVASRLRRTLLLLIDGRHADAELLAAVQGTTPADFEALESLGLIARVAEAPADVESADDFPSWTIPSATASETADDAEADESPLAGSVADAPAGGPAPAPVPAPRGEEADVVFAQTLADLIESELGLWGFSLALAVDKAASTEELEELAERVIAAITDRRGEPQGEAARQTLYGGR